MDMVYTDNPLQNISNSKDATSNINADNRVYELEMENANKNQEITDLKSEITDVKTKKNYFT